ncbi:MAG: hypothetical protein ACLTT3_02970 [Roseburia faecis]|jgi:hypothetical protein|nr:hypothetical protein [Roseburia faecis]MEE1518508.1 hypothetical protein [Dialister invisus]DAK72889.1 MAG TPA: protein of unknown function (DUF5052) [Caudoviricetes sp.]DAL88982.1 MAG TPA: protein of unknown function (DUF5052) [Caudoviricetes sp.]DAW63765.1 MAG TPA: protein of unknown function (DUF5052) [Caudoviricetes sp.]
MTKNKKFIVIAVSLSLAASMLFAGCSEADKANYNISKQADYFESERKLTVYNARTDTIILETEGYMSISNNDNGELVCTVKTGKNTYKKNYVYLNENTMYVVEDITGTHTDPYHYKMYFHTEQPVSVETKP